jgi:Arc/MetJ family transcription regulator
MRTNIDIDDEVLQAAMRAGGFKTKKDAVEAGLRLIARQAHYREVLRWEGRLHWDGDDEGLSTPPPVTVPLLAQEPAPAATPAGAAPKKGGRAGHARR